MDGIRPSFSGRRFIELELFSVGVGLLLLPVFTRSADAAGDIEYYRMYPGLDSSDLFQYGMHFGEGDVKYGARDFNRPGNTESGQAAYLRVQLSKSYASNPLVFRLTHEGGCGVQAEAGFMSGGSFVAYSSQRFHFLHLKASSRVSNNTITAGISAINASVYQQVGTVEPTGGACAAGGAHLHQSGNISTSTGVYRHIIHTSGETCWSSTEGSNTWQCPATYYKTHVDFPGSHGGCGSYSGYTGGLSGTISTQYNCEEWSYAGQTTLAQWPSATKVFYVMGPAS